MAKTSCVMYPEVNGKPSRLYKDLLEKSKLERTLTNYIYAAYKASDMADKMDQAGYKRNAQDEHNASDVLKFIDWSTWQSEISSLSQTERQIGATDSNGKRIDYTNAKEALEKADALNKSSKGLVATVIQHGDVYNIIVAEKNSRTHNYSPEVEEKLKLWDFYKQVFGSKGINIEAMPQELTNTFSAYNTDLIQRLINLQKIQIDYLDKKGALTLFNMDPNSPEMQRLVKAFGSLENAAQAVADINHRVGSYTTAQKTLLQRAITKAKQFQGLNLSDVKDQADQMATQVRTGNPEEDIQQTLHQLNKQYKLDINEIHRISTKINTLSEAAADAAITLQRQIRQLQKEKGNNVEGKRLNTILEQLMRELNNKRYYSGVLNFMQEASNQVSGIDQMLQNIPQTGTEIEKAFATAKILQDIKSLKDQFYPLISALADDNLTIDESIGQADIDNIRQTAKILKEFIDKKDKVIDDLTESTMVTLMTQIVGDTAPDGQSMLNVIRMAAADSTYYDYLYSVGRASNPIIGAMGSIIRNAQDERDGFMNNMSLRIRRATDKLYKSGSDSSYMYEDDGHIVSDIDWGLYKAARKAQIKSLYKQGLRDFDLKQAIEDWEDINTEDRVVDSTNNRTERVPNWQYRKNYDFQENWTPAQKEYYDTMMQIKGEIGSLLPAYAQHQYLPPQIRREMLDALGDAQSVKDVAKAFKNKAQNLWKIREDDTNYNMNGIIDGDEYKITEGAFDNTPLRQIPIFFVNKVEEGELLKNFSTGLAALAGTAANYDAMSNIAQVVEFIGDFAKNQEAKDKDQKADIVENKQIRVFKNLVKRGKNDNTEGLINGFIAQHIYGQHQAENSEWAKLWNNIIAYTSFKGLATNVKGAFSNYLVGEFQMMIEAGAGEFYGIKDYAWAHTKLFGGTGVAGEIAELLTNNVNHKGVLLSELFDPIQENFSDKGNTKYYKSMFRQLVSKDCSFIGYASGEYLIHYVNMYAMLHNQKVLLNGKKISLFDAFEVTNKKDGNSELQLKKGVTQLDGSAITDEWLDTMRKKIRYVNQTTHGSMNAEDKGLLHQHWWGRGIMNFRQWMVEHYSRRFRARHFDASLGMDREGYWTSFWQMYRSDETADAWKQGKKLDAVGLFVKDFTTFAFRAQAQWQNLDEMQRSNVKRVISEMSMYVALLGLSFALGEPDQHKKEWWRRWWIYQVRRLMLDTEASMPHPKAISSGLTILQSPMAGVNTINSLLYTFYGLTNGDLTDTIKSGPHKGENKYWRNIKKYVLPFFKDWEQMQRMSEDESIFQVFKDSPSNR